MKKNHVKILANALYEASYNKKGKDLDKVITNFSAYLSQHYLVSMIPSILAEIENIHFSKEGIVKTLISSSEELDQVEVKKIVQLVKARTSQEVAVKTDIEQSLVGGVVIKYKDKIIDMSIKRQLNNLEKQLSN